MSRTIRNLSPDRIKRAEMGLYGIDHLEAGETLEAGMASRVDSTGATRVTSTGATRGVTYDDPSFKCWWKIVPAVKSAAVTMDSGCEVLYGEPPRADDTATADSPIMAPFTKVKTKSTGGDAHAFRLS